MRRVKVLEGLYVGQIFWVHELRVSALGSHQLGISYFILAVLEFASGETRGETIIYRGKFRFIDYPDGGSDENESITL